MTCPTYFTKLSELAELTAPADGSATAGAFHKKVGGVCLCFRCGHGVISYDIQMRHSHAKDPGLNVKKVIDRQTDR